MKDLSQKEFEKKCRKHGFTPSRYGLVGYFELGNGVSVSTLAAEAGTTRREQLAYLNKKADEMRGKAEGG